MYVQRNVLVPSRNYCCNWNAKKSVLFTVALHVTVNNIKLGVSQWWFYAEFMSPTTKRNSVFMQSAHYFCSILTKFGMWQIFIYVTKIKFHENPSSGSRAGTCRRHTETTKIIGTHRDYAHAPKRVGDIKHRSHYHIQIFVNIQNEFNATRAVWLQLRLRVSKTERQFQW